MAMLRGLPMLCTEGLPTSLRGIFRGNRNSREFQPIRQHIIVSTPDLCFRMSTLQEKSTRTDHVGEDSFLKCDEKPSASFESTNSELIFVKQEPLVSENSIYSGNTKGSIDANFDLSLVDDTGTARESLLNFDNGHCSVIRSCEEAFQETKIDIHDHHLKQESYSQSLTQPTQLKRPTCLRKAFRQNFVNSLGVLCDICDDNKIERVIKLNKQERLTAAVVLKKGLSLGLKRKRVFSREIPVQSCGRCFTRIVLFRNRFEEKLLKKKIKIETEMHPLCNHGIDCPCPTCQNRYGSLGLIIRGMETLSSQASFQNMPQPQGMSALEDNRQEQGDFQVRETPPVNYQVFDPTQQPLNPRNLLQSGSVQCDNMQVTDVIRPTDYYNIPATVPTTSYADEPQHFQTYSGLSRQQYVQSPMEIHSSTVDTIQEESEDKPFPFYTTSTSETSVDIHTGLEEHETRESTLPLTLQDFEDRTRQDFDQPSTSRGYPEGVDEGSFLKSKRVCIHCQKQFNHTGDFRKHLRKHTKEKPYACKQCDKRFSHTSNLHRHERSHTGARPYKCEFCNKEFNRKDKLDSHKKSKSCKNRRQEGTN